MKTRTMTFAGTMALAAALLASPVMSAETKADKAHAHDHGQAGSASKGYFYDSQVKARDLTDWEGDWQSIYPYLMDGTLDSVMAHKAEKGDMTAEQYRAYYETGYRTDVSRIVIDGNTVTFYRGDQKVSGYYVSDGHEILTYKKGNRGVRFIFRKSAGDAAAPEYIQFSDHIIAPQKAGHYHLYWGDDRAKVLAELTNWPTYFPSDMGRKEILEDMLAH